MQSAIDREALHGFLEESKDSLQGIEAAFVELERDPANIEVINRIFRPVHSMKGNSGFFGLTNINVFAHRLEDLLDSIRKGTVAVDAGIIDILLTGIDYLQGMLERAFEQVEEAALTGEEEKFLKEKVEQCKPKQIRGSINSILSFEELFQKTAELGLNIQDNALLLNVFEHVEKANQYMQGLVREYEKSLDLSRYSSSRHYFYGATDYTEKINRFLLVLRSLAGHLPIDKFLHAEFVQTLAEVESVLHAEEAAAPVVVELRSLANFLDDPLMVGNADFIHAISGFLNDLISHFQVQPVAEPKGHLLGEILMEQKLVTESQIGQALSKQEKIGEILLRDGLVQENDLKKALAIQERRTLDHHLQQKAPAESTKTIRIDQAKLDSFANSVGELFISIDSFNFVRKQLLNGNADLETFSKFTNSITLLDNLVAKLQDNVMSIRKVPVKNLFQRFPRVVRQLSTSLAKEIDFIIEGEETVIDKDLLEDIENPLVHLLRNAVDHGIEAPETRRAAGKSPQGRLELKVTVDEYYVYLSITDDGAGIDPQKMKEVAVNKGFLTEAAASSLSDKDLLNLIFRPGFSTAAEVSDVSGRGVGMDVVMSVLQRTNGVVAVDSRVHQGTQITIKIPLTRTLVTKDALIVKSAGQLFAILSEEIGAIMYPEDNVVNLLGGQRGISHNGVVLRLVDINHFYYFTPESSQAKIKEQVVVICEQQQLALLVDEVFSHQQIVVKVFGRGYVQFRDIPGIYGYTILGNEDVVLIADLQKFAAYGGEREAECSMQNAA